MAFGEHKGNDYYLDKASSLQDKTENTLERTTQMIEASKEVGASTLSELERQQDQIKDVSADIMLIEDNLSRADRLIRNFTKRMMTDKLIMGFAFLNMCALTGIIVYCVVTGKVLGDDKKKDKEDGPDESERRLFLRGGFMGTGSCGPGSLSFCCGAGDKRITCGCWKGVTHREPGSADARAALRSDIASIASSVSAFIAPPRRQRFQATIDGVATAKEPQSHAA